MTTAADVAGAYKWTRDWMKEPLLPLPEIHNPAQGAKRNAKCGATNSGHQGRRNKDIHSDFSPN